VIYSQGGETAKAAVAKAELLRRQRGTRSPRIVRGCSPTIRSSWGKLKRICIRVCARRGYWRS